MFKWLLASALVLSIAFCAAADFVKRRTLAEREAQVRARRVEIRPLAPIIAEVMEYQKQKDQLQERIDLINQLKQNQRVPAESIAMLSAIEGDSAVDSVAIVGAKNIVINGHGDADRIAAHFEHATKRVAADNSFALQVTASQ